MFDVLAYFVYSLVSQRELQKLREAVADAVEGKAGQENFHIG